MNIGSVIKYYRSRNGLTQAQLAEGICSVSHLSKIESNTYTPHESTIEELLAKMGIQRRKAVEKYRLLEEQLEAFIDCSLHYDLEGMNRQLSLLEEENEFIQSTDLVTRYELYKYRFFILNGDSIEMSRQQELLDRLKSSFSAPESWLHRFFRSLHHAVLNENDRAISLLDQLDTGIQSIPQKFEGEYYYQKARLLVIQDLFELSAHYAQMAVQFFQLHHNYIRLLHAQLLLAINYTRRNLLVQAGSIYEVLKRNARLTGQMDLYYQALYNFAELLKQKGEPARAFRHFEELMDHTAGDPYFYKSVLVSIIEAGLEIKLEVLPYVEKLKKLSEKDEEAYFQLYSNYFEKRIFSQPDLWNYCEEKMFHYFKKNGYIKEARKIASELAAHFRKEQEWEKANFYSTY